MEVERVAIERARPVVPADQRPVAPGEEEADRSGQNRDRDGERCERGDGPPRPSEALGPGVPEGAGLQLLGQHRRADERSDQRGITWKRAAVSVNECPAAPLNERACWPMKQQVQAHGAEHRDETSQREPVLSPGDPGHSPPRHRPPAGIASRMRWHGQRGQRANSVGSACRARIGPGSDAAPGSRRYASASSSRLIGRAFQPGGTGSVLPSVLIKR